MASSIDCTCVVNIYRGRDLLIHVSVMRIDSEFKKEEIVLKVSVTVKYVSASSPGLNILYI